MADMSDLRAARNAYNSAVRAADGYVSGKRVHAVSETKKRLAALLWEHRDLLVNAVSEPI